MTETFATPRAAVRALAATPCQGCGGEATFADGVSNGREATTYAYECEACGARGTAVWDPAAEAVTRLVGPVFGQPRQGQSIGESQAARDAAGKRGESHV